MEPKTFHDLNPDPEVLRLLSELKPVPPRDPQVQRRNREKYLARISALSAGSPAGCRRTNPR